MLESTPNNIDEQLCLLSIYFASMQYQDGYDLFQRIKDIDMEVNNQHKLLVLGGDICKKLGKLDEAFLYWQTAYELNIGYTDPLWSMAFSYEEQREYQKAYEMWIKIAEIHKNRGLLEESSFPYEQAQKMRSKY